MSRAPQDRVKNQNKEIEKIRRKHNTQLNRRKKLLPAEVKYTQTTVCVLRLAGYNRVQIAQAVGISKSQVREIFESPEFNEEFEVLSTKVPQAAVDLLQSLMIEAVMSIAEVMRVSLDDKLVLQASEAILDRGGAPKASRKENHNTNEDKTTFEDNGIVERLRQAPVEVQEEAAQIIERLEDLLRASVGQNSTDGVESS